MKILTIVMGWLCVLTAFACGGESLVIADFENGNGGFSGTLTVEEGTGKIANADQKWVIASVELSGLEQDFTAFSFKAKTTDAQMVAVRFTDSTGQNFQQRLPLKNNGEWQQIHMRDFSKGQSWGGAEDKKWHPPAKKIDLILEQKGSLWIDDVQAQLTGKMLPQFKKRHSLLAKALDYKIANFKSGPEGFGGSIKIEKDANNGDLPFMHLSKPADQRWASTGKTFRGLKQDFLQVTFKVRSDKAQMLAMRFKDNTGQDFQQRLPLNPDGKWHLLTITEFNKGRSWGGANDKKWHAPAKSITFILEEDGSVDIADIQAKLNPEKIRADLGWQNSSGPMIFSDGTKVRVPLETIADTVDYTITNIDQKVITKGSVKVANGQAAITHHSDNGYFLVKATGKKGGQTIGEIYTSYAVIPPYKVKDHAKAPWGVMTHFAQGMDPKKLMPVMEYIGIVAIRDEHYWAQVEKKKGEFSFPAYSEPYMNQAKQNNLDTLIAMTFANKNHDKGLTPHTDEGCDAYGVYGQEIIKKFGSQIKWLEVWNEYNGTWCKGPAAKDRSKSYAKLVKHAYKKIKEKNPNVKVLGAACVLIPIPYIEGIFRNDGIKYMDGVVIHPYRGRPESVDREVDELRELIRKYNDGKDKEIWVTETGRMDKEEYPWEVGRKMYEKGRRNAAQYLARQYTLLLKSGCEKIFWYLASDHLEFVSMGLLRNADEPSGMGDYAVAPAAVSYATLIRMLDGKKYFGREGVRKYTRAHCYKFSDGSNEDVRTVWATAPAKMDFFCSSPLSVTSLMGSTKEYKPQDGRVRLELGESIQYVRGKVDRVVEVDTGVRYLASSADDYSKTQGENNWYYGYRKGIKGEFVPMTQVETMWGVDWGAEKIKYLKQSESSGHPAGNGKAPIYVDRRWVSSYTGEVTVKATVKAVNKKGDGIEFIVQTSTGEQARKMIKADAPKQDATTEFKLTVKEGETVDFLFGPGANSNYDAFSFDLQIIEKQ